MRAQALAVLLTTGLAVAGCGGASTTKKATSPLPGTPSPEAKKVAQAYLDAYAAKSARRICTVLAPSARSGLTGGKGTCLTAMRKALKGTVPDGLTAGETRAVGDTAHALVIGGVRQITLMRVGSTWKIVDGGT